VRNATFFKPRLEALEDHMGRGERRMSTEIHLHRRREPAQRIVRRLAQEESGLGEVVLRRNGLERGVGQPGLERHDRRGIAGEQAVGEGIDLIDRKAHRILLTTAAMIDSTCPSQESENHMDERRGCTSRVRD
jgi:hypothetical protein